MGRIWITKAENQGSFVTAEQLDELIKTHKVYATEFKTPDKHTVIKYKFRAT